MRMVKLGLHAAIDGSRSAGLSAALCRQALAKPQHITMQACQHWTVTVWKLVGPRACALSQDFSRVLALSVVISVFFGCCDAGVGCRVALNCSGAGPRLSSRPPLALCRYRLHFCDLVPLFPFLFRSLSCARVSLAQFQLWLCAAPLLRSYCSSATSHAH